jgi:peptidoglycan glycosyltransferase
MMVNRSISRLTNVFLALFMLLSVGVVYWQVFQSQTLATSTYNPSLCDVGNQPVRGSIYDRNGVLLAYSQVDPKAPCNYRRYYCFPSLSPIIGYFSYIYGETGLEAAYDNILTGRQSSGQSTINNFWDQTLHRPVYGSDIYLTIDVKVQILIDKEYDITNDEPGGNFPSDPIHVLPRGQAGPPPTEPIPSRCDKNLVEQYNQPAENAPHNHPGSVIVEDPHTGQILGMLSRPYFNANEIGDYTPCRLYKDDTKYAHYPDCPGAQAHLPATQPGANAPTETSTIGAAYFQQLTHDPLSPLLTRPTGGLYVPGSTFKTVTLAAALDTGKYHLTDTFDQADGQNCRSPNSHDSLYVVNSFPFRDQLWIGYNPPPSCPVDLKHGYIYSDNVIYARLGVGVGANDWLNYAQRFGISDSNNPQALPVDFPLAASTLPFQGANGVEGQDHQVDLAAAAFGQGKLLVTPLEMTFVTSTVANDGVGLLPQLLYKVVPCANTGTQIVTPCQEAANPSLTYTPKPYTENGVNNGQIISPQTAQEVREAMRGVVQQGSAGVISGSPANVGGKTGTGQLSNADPHSWFISLAPDNPGQTPKYVVVVMRENGDEGLFQAPVTDCIYRGLFNLPPSRTGSIYPGYNCA